MSTNSDRLRGVITQDHRISTDTIESTETTATQAGPHPGPAVDQGSSSMVLRSSGEMAASQTYTVTAERGGYPGPHATSAGFSYAYSGNTYGWDPPGVLTGCEYVVFNRGGAASRDSMSCYEPSLCVLSSGVVLMATRSEDNTTNEVSVRIRQYDPSTNAWTELENLTDGTTIDDSQRIGPCLVVTPDGVVHLYYYVAATVQIAHWISGDDGATWSQVSKGCLTTDLTTGTDYSGDDLTTFGASIDGAYSAGNVCLLVGLEGYGTDPSYLLLITSSDGGYSFQADSEYADTDADFDDWRPVGNTPEAGGGFRISFAGIAVTDPATDATWYHYKLGSGYFDFRALNGTVFDYFAASGNANADIDESAHSVIASEGGNIDSEVTGTSWATEDGVYQAAIAYGDQDDTTPSDRGALSIERMDGSGTMQQLCATTIDHGPAAADGLYLRRPVAVETQGLTIVAAQCETNGGGVDNGSIVVFYLGGHTTLTQPPASASDPVSMQRLPFAWQFHALDDPDNGATFSSGASTGTLTTEKEGLKLSCTSAQTYYFVPNSGTGPTDESAELFFEMAAYGVVSAGHTGGVNQPRCGALLTYRHNAGTAQYTVLLNMSATGITLYDSAGGSSLGTASVDLTGDVEVRVTLYRSRVNAWYREVGSNGRVERTWTQFVTAGTVTSAAVSASAHVVQWGMISTAASGTHEMYVKRVQLAEVPAGQLATDGVAGTDLYARPLPSTAVTIPKGLKLEALDGPAVPGDSWQIETAYHYGFANLFTDNPAQTWRSLTDGTLMTIAFDISGYSSAGGGKEIYAFGAALLRSNLRRWKIQTMSYLGKGTAVDWLTVYAQPFAVYEAPAAEDIFAFAAGQILQPDSGSEPCRWLEHNELAGCQIYDDNGGTSYRIIGNSSGEWAGEWTHREAQIFIHPDDDLSGWDGTTGAYIHLRNSAGFIWDSPAQSRWLLLTIPAQETYEGYYEIGRLVAGPLHAFGREYSEDRALEQQANVELTTRRDGSRYAYSRGEQRRAVTVAWREGVDETALYTTAEPKEVPYVAGYTSNYPVANPADTVKLVRGLFSQVDGASEPLVYLPSIPTNIESGSLTAPDALLYGRIVSQIEIGQILGNEEEDPVHRLGAIRIEEEVG